MTRILAIDDDKRNLKLIEHFLEERSYDLVTASDGEDGWQVLKADPAGFDLILLDRMMPGMSGIEFMQRLKQDEEAQKIPVIMQTASAESERVAEGIRAGVYYYLTKPYDQRVLLSVVDAALDDYRLQRKLDEEVAKQKRMLHLVVRSEFLFRTLNEAQELAVFLANLYPNPSRVAFGISEMLRNAVEHGNLGITYAEKTDFMRDGTLNSELVRRQEMEPYCSRRVEVKYRKWSNAIELTIEDEGEGFEFHRYLELDPKRVSDNHGRGIAMARLLSFDRIEYVGRGNRVVCTVNY